MKKFMFIGLIGSILIWGSYQIMISEDEDVTAVQDEPKLRHTQNIDVLVKQAMKNYNQLKKQHETLQVNNETVLIDDPKVKNWIIHTHIQSAVLANEDLEGIALVDQAMEYKQTNEAIIQWAKDVHNIVVTDQEIEEYIQKQLTHIENGDSSHPFFIKISEALDLTEAQYFYEWEYDRFAQLLVQEKLYTLYQEKFPQFEDEQLEDYQERIVTLMEKDLKEYRSLE